MYASALVAEAKRPARRWERMKLDEALLETWAVNEGVNQFLLRSLPKKLWRAELVGTQRTIAQIFAHLHNCRLTWLKMVGQRKGLPRPLDRRRCTPQQAARALRQSAAACARFFRRALNDDGYVRHHRHVTRFLIYLLAHDAHHRGQVMLLARQMLGRKLPDRVAYGIWQWSARLKETRK